jgi:hypothetical protein
MADGGRSEGVRSAGAVMALAALLSVVAMAHHPTGAHGAGFLARFVHGAMIAFLLLMLFGWARFARARGLARSFPLAGLIAYAASAFAHLAAATINGFAVPTLAARKASHDLFVLSWDLNQAFAQVGVFLTSAAFLFWSLDLAVKGAGFSRVVGLIGLAAAIGPAAALAAGAISMDVHGAFIVYAAHAVFAALVGAQMLRGKV